MLLTNYHYRKAKQRKKADQKRSRDLKSKERLARLRSVDRLDLKEKIRTLEEREHLGANDLKRLEQWKRDLQFSEKNSLGHEEKHSNVEELGARSIFYDPDWNPSGTAPKGYKNIPYNPNTFTRQTDSFPPQLAGLEDVAIPLSETDS